MEVLAADTSGEPIVTFCGAARSVTGSMHLLETGENRLLLDCGLFLGSPAEELQRNGHFPFPAHEIDAVILSHAHIDHCGNLPNLVRQGFAGPIYCTPATRDLIELMLVDSAKFQQEEAVLVLVAGCFLDSEALDVDACAPHFDAHALQLQNKPNQSHFLDQAGL